MGRVILVRHGETVWNAEGRMQGHTDVALSERGVRQAHLTADRLRGVPLEAVYSSDLTRASATAEVVAAPHGLSVVTTPALREACLGAWQGRTVKEAEEMDADLVALWRQNSLEHRPPGGERLEEVAARAVPAVRSIAENHADGAVAVVAHGGPIKTVICWAIGAPLSCMRHIRLDNGSISVIRFRADRVELETLNDTCHLSEANATPVF